MPLGPADPAGMSGLHVGVKSSTIGGHGKCLNAQASAYPVASRLMRSPPGGAHCRWTRPTSLALELYQCEGDAHPLTSETPTEYAGPSSNASWTPDAAQAAEGGLATGALVAARDRDEQCPRSAARRLSTAERPRHCGVTQTVGRAEPPAKGHAGRQLPAGRRRTLERARDELRRAFGRT
jgi:hypothetical protein